MGSLDAAGPFASETWDVLDRSDGQPTEAFDPGTLATLPAPARRLLSAALPDGCDLHGVVRLEMAGHIKLGGRWLRFTATQILRAGVGFVWAPVVGGRLIRFVGADALGPEGARIEFRLHGRLRVVRGSGPDIDRSAAGRLAAETAAWLPHALTPQCGARWTGVDDRRAVVTLDGPSGPVDVEVSVDANGRIDGLGLQRWNDAAKPPGFQPFGGSVGDTFIAADGVGVAGSGTVGWGWGTSGQGEGEFFRYEVTGVSFGPTPGRGAPRSSRRPTP